MSDGSHFDPGSEAELERPQLQALCVEGLTCRLIRESGIRPGMRVLDLGAGPGDVAFLVAEAVGPSGSVVGVDREERSVELAKRRSAETRSQVRPPALGWDPGAEARSRRTSRDSIAQWSVDWRRRSDRIHRSR